MLQVPEADARSQNMVHMNQTHPPVYQSVIEKVSSSRLVCLMFEGSRPSRQTRGFSFRTAAMGQAIDRKAHPPASGDGGAGGGRGGRGGARGGRGGGRGGSTGRGGGRSGGREEGEGAQSEIAA